MKIISVITENEAIEKVLKHKKLWEENWNKSSPEEDKVDDVEHITYEPIEGKLAVNY